VGCGLGADGARFAQNGAIYTGIDLTPAAVEATRLHFQSLGLPGTFKVQNAESMEQIESEIFDLVYSHGVLHHTPDIRAALGEIWRVLKPGGELTLMLYHRRSFNYYVRILTFMRLQVLTYLAARRFLPARRRSGPLEMHYRGYARMGAKYLSSAEFPHHCTDGPECPLARAFTPREVEHLLGPAFTDLRFAVAHLPLHKRLPFVPLGVERFLASRLGWYLFVFARKA
jgi:SAM-dependent methyltransferase